MVELEGGLLDPAALQLLVVRGHEIGAATLLRWPNRREVRALSPNGNSLYADSLSIASKSPAEDFASIRHRDGIPWPAHNRRMSLQTAGIGRIRHNAPPMLISRPPGKRLATLRARECSTVAPRIQPHDDAPRCEHIRARPLNILRAPTQHIGSASLAER